MRARYGCVSLKVETLKKIDKVVSQNESFTSRAEFVNEAIRERLLRYGIK